MSQFTSTAQPVETVSLPNTNISTTRLGFGCGNLPGSKTREEGLRLLNTAYDAGIRHFDVAWYYGFGEAESLVGEFARGKRDRITITTKFGIQPPVPDSSSFLGRLQVCAANLDRQLVRQFSRVRRLVQRNVSNVVRTGEFDADSARERVETSLQTLDTTYIDVLLLHGCSLKNCTPELLGFLEQMREEGKIRAYGVGTGVDETIAICANAPNFTNVVQFPNDITGLRDARAVCEGRERAVINHGVLSKARALRQWFEENPDRADACNDEIGADCRDAGTLTAFLLQHALRANPEGIILFRSESLNRVRANVQAAREPQLSDEQLDRFGDFIARWYEP